MAKAPKYSRLDASSIISTIATLEGRIAKRFGERGLTRIARELRELAEKAEGRVERLARANWGLLLVPVVVTALIVYLTWAMATNIDERLAAIDQTLAADVRKLIDVLRQIKSDIAIPIVIAVPIPLVITMFAFIWSLEARWKRHRALRYLHELRSIIHVIDMHQLPKDPRLVSDGSDPEFVQGEDLVYYLDYCAELLSLSGKVAALYAESSHDPVVIESVSDLGEITANLGNKIWHKLGIVERQLAADGHSRVARRA